MNPEVEYPPLADRSNDVAHKASRSQLRECPRRGADGKLVNESTPDCLSGM